MTLLRCIVRQLTGESWDGGDSEEDEGQERCRCRGEEAGAVEDNTAPLRLQLHPWRALHRPVQSDAGFKEPGGGAAAVTGRGAADRF
ncbi:hypothetical protein VPH35_096356 [Triticum aestivum]